MTNLTISFHFIFPLAPLRKAFSVVLRTFVFPWDFNLVLSVLRLPTVKPITLYLSLHMKLLYSSPSNLQSMLSELACFVQILLLYGQTPFFMVCFLTLSGILFFHLCILLQNMSHHCLHVVCSGQVYHLTTAFLLHFHQSLYYVFQF